MSIVQNIDEQELQREKVISERLPIRNLQASLKIILTKGDLVESTRYPNLQLKNFGTLSQWRVPYIVGAENAYGRAMDLMTTMSQKLSASSTGIPEQFRQTFKAYFGDPDAKVDDVGKLGFKLGLSPLVIIGSLTRGAVVRAVLDCVWQGLRTRPVRLYFGGGIIIPDVRAYTNRKVRNDRRINIHLAYDFFSKYNYKAIKGAESSRAGLLIHELTHALAGTIDREFSYFGCRMIAIFNKALINAQSYACFVDDALD